MSEIANKKQSTKLQIHKQSSNFKSYNLQLTNTKF